MRARRGLREDSWLAGRLGQRVISGRLGVPPAPVGVWVGLRGLGGRGRGVDGRWAWRVGEELSLERWPDRVTGVSADRDGTEVVRR